MYLSEAQLDLIDKLATEKSIDLMELNIATACALITRGLAFVFFGKKSRLRLTEAGARLNTEHIRNNAGYKRTLAALHDMKYNKPID